MPFRHSQSTEQKHHQRFVLPDPPEREPEDMTSFDHLTLNGSAHHLVQHLGNPQTTMVAGERYITREPGAPAKDRMAPDLLVAFNADLQAYQDSNGYVISEQGKPPDFVLEIASRSTGQRDVERKRPAYAALGITEYWRFDQTGDFHETWLAGDRLVEDRYEPIPIETVEEGVLQGYSSVLNLLIRWDHGELGWHDPETGHHIATFHQERARADAEQTRADTAEAQVNAEQARVDTAEARVRELEEELRRRQEP